MTLLGLTRKQVVELQLKYGKNTIPEKPSGTWTSILIDQFKSPLIYILIVAGVIAIITAEYIDTVLILAVVLLDVIMGFVQEFSAQKTYESLKKITVSRTTVIRDGQMEIVDSTSLVPGDIVLLGSGDKVPADGKQIEGLSLYVSEAILTGESEPVEKKSDKESCHLYMGTSVLSGRATMVVEKTGANTEIGKIGTIIQEIKEEPTPLQKLLVDFARKLSFMILFISVVIYIIGIYNGQDLFGMMRFSIVLAVAAIPEGLPIAVTVILTLGMRRILKKKGLVKRLASIETLGSTSVICTDKTGTLTEGVMSVTSIDTKNKDLTVRGLTYLNTRRTSLEIAIWNYLTKNLKIDPQKSIDKAKVIYEESFESEKKYAMAVVSLSGKKDAFIIGAPDVIINFCSVSAAEKKNIRNQFNEWATSGLRVVGLLHKNTGDLTVKKKFKWLSLIGVTDPIRPSVKESIARARMAHIKVKIVTGDHLITAIKVAEKIGLDVRKQNTLEGKDLEKMSVSRLRKIIDNIAVIARVSPHQKLKIVEALQSNGEIVAMMGDGVNDAPALKKADIGIAVDSAADVAKDSADLILLDNNFQTIVSACEEGRLIFSNLKKVVGYVLSNSFVEMILIFSSLLIGIPFPLTVVQVLWIHMICDGPPDILLGFEPKEEGLMDMSPQQLKKDSILNRSMYFLIFAISLTVGLISLAIFYYAYNTTQDLALARTIAFAAVGSVSMFYVFSYKNLRKNLFSLDNLLSNKPLLLGVVYGLFLVFLGVYSPQVNQLLGTKPFPVSWWAGVILVAILSTAWVEVVKMISSRLHSASV